MEGFDQIKEFCSSSQILTIATVFNTLMILVIFILVIKNRSTIQRIDRTHAKIENEMEKKGVEQILQECIQYNSDLKIKIRELEANINSLERNLLQSIQKVGILRYNAFENVGSDLSFAIALLDSHNNGIVLSGIYSRESTQTYAKPITSANSKYPLSAEEIQAINLAKKNYGERMYTDK